MNAPRPPLLRHLVPLVSLVVAACTSAAPLPGGEVAQWTGPAPGPVPDKARADEREVDLVRRVMPAIVLVVNTRKDGKTTWGAGFFSERGKVLTALHVVEDEGQVAIMLHRPGRQTYSPMDGGILRFLFENGRELVPATIEKRDAVSDLAVLAFDPAAAPDAPILPWSSDDVRPGERVLALGHPQQTPWSFSAGVIGTLQYGLIQHDATVGPGSSGGPLMNTRGEIVGVNVAQVVSQPVGLSFARPAHVVTSAFGDGEARPFMIDLGSPTSSALTCWRAQELALREVADCFDWESSWRQHLLVLEEAASLVEDPDMKARIAQCATRPGEKEAFLERRRTGVVRALDPTASKGKDLDPDDPDLPQVVRDIYRQGLAEWKRTPEHTTAQFADDFRDPERLRSRLRLGLRVEDTRRVAPDLEWVLFASRSPDGSIAHFSELYALIGDRWLQRPMPWPEDLAKLPRTWPPPIETFAVKRKITLAYVVKRAALAEGCSARTS
ncbi:MAG: trypsin-like peptidase domain-containing protein [Deltaproteobacteria bacterium]|nr:trypsin-like peptidase domain-containing protein [Deltaproteobacteria bacterium]